MEISLTTPAILFPAVSLLLIAYTNRYLAITRLMRELKTSYLENHSPHHLKQINLLRKRERFIRNMQAFAIASDINIARFYWHVFEEFQAAPISKTAYVTGEVMAGMTRALLSVGVIMVIGLVFGVDLQYSLAFLTGVLLNSFVFASLAVGLAMVVKSHADQGLLTSFVITPMAFLGGTFFPLDRLPSWAASRPKKRPILDKTSPGR